MPSACWVLSLMEAAAPAVPVWAEPPVELPDPEPVACLAVLSVLSVAAAPEVPPDGLPVAPGTIPELLFMLELESLPKAELLEFAVLSLVVLLLSWLSSLEALSLQAATANMRAYATT